MPGHTTAERVTDEFDEDAPLVLVIGAMAVDAKGQPDDGLVPGASTPGAVRLSIGGVARNIAENLARLGVRACLLSAIGGDAIGKLLLEATARSGVDVQHVITARERRTAAYIAVLDRNGAPAHAIHDMRAIEAVTPAMIYRRRSLFRDASMIVVDANVSPDALQTVFRLADRYGRPVTVDPTSLSLASRVRPYLASTYMIVPNLLEARALVGDEGETMDAQSLAMCLVELGVEIAIITLAEQGLYYATSDERGRVPALQRDIVDLTGAGDALAAAVLFALLHDVPVSEAVRLGISAAALTIQCPETVCPDLSLDRLYDELVI
ncbi:MAG: carbohydrate kinase family protein [Anaerolineae bacterium]|nr:carbohydrate kinase family protein [Anaerolineae bacterium]